MEERAGERRRVFIGFPFPQSLPTRSSQGEDGELDAAPPAPVAVRVARLSATFHSSGCNIELVAKDCERVEGLNFCPSEMILND
jgi:hypothetical protein